MKRHLLTICMSLLTLMAMAIPAKRTTFTVKQSDGKQLTLMLVGDENLHYYINVNTNEKMQRGDDGNFYVISESDMTQRISAAKTRRAESNARRTARMAPRRVGSINGGIKGDKNGLVILVNFSDKALASSHTQAVFNDMFNKEGYSSDGHIGSVADYFRDQSYGQFNLSFDVVGPVTLSKNMAYYGGNDSSGNDLRPAEMVIEACKAVNDQVDFSKYDWDGDNYVDQVFIIYAGYGENAGASSSTIWPHEYDLTSAKYFGDGTGRQYLDGVYVNTYACSSELAGASGSYLSGIGTACHEFSHCLGYPDTYDIDYSGGIGMDSYDIMCSGSYNGPNGRGEVPAGYTAYERMCAGWLEPTELNEPATITGMKDLGTSPTAYILYNDRNSNEFLMFENRQAERWFKYYDSSKGGHGLFVTHIDYNESVWANNAPNDVPSHQRITWIPADKNYKSNPQADFFPGTSNVTALTETSHASVYGKWFATTSKGNTQILPVTEIAESNKEISFLFNGGADDGTRYTITYDAGSGACTTTSWTQTNRNEAATLPTCTIDSDEWQFVGWCTQSINETTTKPTLLTSSYTPTANVTLYAVYRKVDTGTSTSGQYILDYSAETKLSTSTQWGSYGTAYNYTASDGGTWIVKAYKNAGMQINKGQNASIKVPECPGAIKSIVVTDKTARVLKFSSTDYTGSNNPTAAATSASNTTATLDLSDKDLTTGYIYTTDASTVITKIVVNYGGAGSGTATYATYPEIGNLTTPTIAFAESADKSMFVGDTFSNKATATGTTSPVTYKSSMTDVATVDNEGKVTAVSPGETTITASVAAVSGVSRPASATYKVMVTMPALTGLSIKTQPKTDYTEGDKFDATGMVLTATYANGYTQDITSGWTINPSTITKDLTSVTISYTEGTVTKTVTVNITVTPLPLYTVTFNAGDGACETANAEEPSYQAGVILPTCTINSNVWTFAGWSTENVTTTTTKPSTLLAAGSTYKPTADITLYAVYKKTDAGDGDKWMKLTVSEVKEEGTYAIITTDGHAFNGTIVSGHGKATESAFEFDSDGYATSAPAGTCELTLTSVAGGFSVYSEDHGYLYLQRAASGNVNWHDTENYYWHSQGNEWKYKGNGFDAYFRCYNNSSFRSYNGTTTGAPVLFAQKVSSAKVTYSSDPIVKFTISSAGAATYYNSQLSYIMPEGLTGYWISTSQMNNDKGGTVTLQGDYISGTIVPAGEALLIKGAEGTYDLIDTATTGTAHANNLLHGTDEAAMTTGGDKYYMYSSKDGVLGFWWGADNGAAFMNNAHKAYLALTASQAKALAANGFAIDFDDATATAIKNIDVNSSISSAYNLSGQRVSKNMKGIVIVNGKKLLNK